MRPLVADLWRRWFAVGGGLGAYAFVLLAAFWAVPLACRTTGTWVLHAVMAVGLVVAAASLAMAWVQWRGAPPPPAVPAPKVQGAGGWLHLLGVLGRRVGLGAAGLLWSAATAGSPADPDPEPPLPQRRRDMAVVGVVLGVISVILVVFHWVPVFVLDPCG